MKLAALFSVPGAPVKRGHIGQRHLAPHDQIEFLAEQRMVRVRHPKRSTLNVTMRCS